MSLVRLHAAAASPPAARGRVAVFGQESMCTACALHVHCMCTACVPLPTCIV